MINRIRRLLGLRSEAPLWTEAHIRLFERQVDAAKAIGKRRWTTSAGRLTEGTPVSIDFRPQDLFVDFPLHHRGLSQAREKAKAMRWEQ